MNRFAMPEWAHPTLWPVSAKVPALVVAFMIAVSATITNGVLSRLVETQNRHLTQLSGAYLDGLSSALLPHLMRDDVWEVYDVLERAAQRYKGLAIDWTTVTDASGTVIASSQPHRFPLQSQLPEDVLRYVATGTELAIVEVQGLASLKRDLSYQGRSIGTIFAQVRIGSLMDERREVLKTLVLTNALLTIVLAAIAYALIRRMLRPLRTLSQHMREGATGNVLQISDQALPRPHSEFGRLFRRYNSLVAAVSERERLLGRLADEKRLAALGRLASGMAHEINNPLGGMLNTLDALKRHGEREHVRQTSTRLLEQGLTGIRDVVRAALATYRQDREMRSLAKSDLDDLSLLLRPEVSRRNLVLNWSVDVEEPIVLRVADVRGSTLNILLNACAASPVGATITFSARASNGRLEVTVEDEGVGLPDEVLDYLRSPGGIEGPAEERGGLGLWMVKRYVSECGGAIDAHRRSPRGSSICLTIPGVAQKEQAPCRLQVA